MSTTRTVSLLVGTILILLINSCSTDSMIFDDIAARNNDNSIRFASFNIHYVAAGQTKLNWDNRKQAVIDALEDLQADIIAFQEMETFAGGSFNTENRQLDWITQHLPQYSAGAYGDARIYPNTQPILFRSDRFEQQQQGFFFFSDTPEVIYSRTFNGSWPAFCSWSVLIDRHDNREYYVFNVHFEYRSMSNRSKSATLVASRIAPLVAAGKAVVLLGDTNAFSFLPTTKTLKKIPLNLAPPTGSTFHFNRGLRLLPAIDHVFFSTGLLQSGVTHRLLKHYEGVWPSDHYPVAVDLLPTP